MTEFDVNWRMSNGKVIGSSRAGGYRKIIFPERGTEAGCCLKPGHYTRCRLVRDTKPEDRRTGALIVALLGECHTCPIEAEILASLPGWTQDGEGALITPDGVHTAALPVENNYYLQIKCKEYATRKALADLESLLPAILAEAPTLPYPEHEPALNVTPPSWCEPAEWMHIPGSQNMGVRLDGQVGPLRVSAEYEYISPDEMGTRIGGGETYVDVIDDPVLREQATPIAAHLRRLHETRDARYAQHREDRRGWFARFKVWWDWWQDLTLAARVRRLLQCEQGRLGRIDPKGELHGVEEGTTRKNRRYFKPTFLFDCDTYDGDRILRYSSCPFRVNVRYVLVATDLLVDSVSVLTSIHV
jgi:hypothetical protein